MPETALGDLDVNLAVQKPDRICLQWIARRRAECRTGTDAESSLVNWALDDFLIKVTPVQVCALMCAAAICREVFVGNSIQDQMLSGHRNWDHVPIGKLRTGRNAHPFWHLKTLANL